MEDKILPISFDSSNVTFYVLKNQILPPIDTRYSLPFSTSYFALEQRRPLPHSKLKHTQPKKLPFVTFVTTLAGAGDGVGTGAIFLVVGALTDFVPLISRTENFAVFTISTMEVGILPLFLLRGLWIRLSAESSKVCDGWILDLFTYYCTRIDPAQTMYG